MRKITIGLLVDEVDNNFTNEICRGAIRAAKELDVNLVIFFGGYLRNHYRDYSYQKNMVFSLAKAQDIDLLIISMGSIVKDTVDLKEKLLQFFGDVPIVTLNTVFDKYSSVIFDNALGLEEALEFLICDLKKTNLTILGGRKGGHDGHIRREIFRKVLNKYYLLKSENQIIYSHSLDRDAYDDVEELLQKNPNTDAIICFNDEVAIAAYHVLKKHNIKIGKDIAVLGFDDIHEASRLNPSLSSISAPPYFLGYQAIIKGREMLEDKMIFHDVLPTRFMKRESLSKEGLSNRFFKNIDQCLVNHDLVKLWSYVEEYIFGVTSLPLTEELHQVLKTLILDMVSLDLKAEKLQDNYQLIEHDIQNLMQIQHIEYLDTTRTLNVLEVLSKKYIGYCLDSYDKQALYEDFYENILKNVAIKLDSLILLLNRHNYESNHTINLMSRTMMVFNNQRQCYSNILEALKNLNVKNASLFLFDSPLKIKSYDALTGYEPLNMVGYIRNGESTVVDGNIRIKINELFLKDTIRDYANYIAVTSIYTNEYFYGFLLCDVFLESYSLLEYLDIHIGVSIYTLNLIDTLDTQSKIDQLTSLYNRRGIFEKITEFVQSKKDDESVYILFADLDQLKVINDIYGHDEGDIAIKKIGILLKETFEENAIVGRIGGDEFLVLFKSSLDNITDIVSTQLKSKEDELNHQFKRKIDACISYGIKKIENVSECDFDEEINAADKLMYTQKRNKKNKEDIIIIS